jgi:carbon storage regulator CsrA
MLVVSRRVDERVVITTPGGEKLSIMVVRIDAGSSRRVRIGIDAPKGYRILREELGKKERISS